LQRSRQEQAATCLPDRGLSGQSEGLHAWKWQCRRIA
jgi:hypothetical protein